MSDTETLFTFLSPFVSPPSLSLSFLLLSPSLLPSISLKHRLLCIPLPPSRILYSHSLTHSSRSPRLKSHSVSLSLRLSLTLPQPQSHSLIQPQSHSLNLSLTEPHSHSVSSSVSASQPQVSVSASLSCSRTLPHAQAQLHTQHRLTRPQPHFLSLSPSQLQWSQSS